MSTVQKYIMVEFYDYNENFITGFVFQVWIFVKIGNNNLANRRYIYIYTYYMYNYKIQVCSDKVIYIIKPPFN